MFSGLPLTDDIRDQLFLMAQGMIRTKKSKGVIKTPKIEGIVTTKWHRRGLGNTYGFEFVANIETENDPNVNNITYLIKNEPASLDDIHWSNQQDTGLFEPFCLN